MLAKDIEEDMSSDTNIENSNNNSEDIDINEALKARAKKLAQKKELNLEQGDLREVLKFSLANENYAIDLKYVFEVIKNPVVRAVPQAPAFVKGITNLRGTLVLVLDFVKKLGIKDSEEKGSNYIIFLGRKKIEYALITNGNVSIRDISKKIIQKIPESLSKNYKEDYLEGVTNDSLILFNADSLLNDESLAVSNKISLKHEDN